MRRRSRSAVQACVLPLLAFTTLAVAGPVTIGVAPPRVELRIDGGTATEAVRVFNFGDRPAEIRTTVQPWDLDEANQVRPLEPSPSTLDQWMIVSPVRFTVPPGGSQTVRFSVRPRLRPSPGEHRAMLYFEQRPDGAAPAGQLEVLARIGIAVYAYAGEPVRSGRLHGVEVRVEDERPTVRFDVSSVGNAHVRLSGTWSLRARGDDGSATVGEGQLPGVPVLAGTRRRLTLPLDRDLAAGEYVLEVLGELSGSPVELEIPFILGATHVADRLGG